MRRRLMKGIHAASVVLISLTMILPVHTMAGLPRKNVSNVQQLAACIDKLESHIDQYGSVVPKQPDVWGQARMQKYRRMVETILESQKSEFRETINASISRSDQASFVNALALQAAISGPQSFVTRRGGSTVVTPPPPPPVVAPTSTTTTSTSSTATATPAAPTVINPATAIDPTTLVDLESLAFTTTLANTRTLSSFRGSTGGIALEPMVMLDQMTTYLNHLNQLRRTNEGDDTADAPGYALHLVRIPVSVLPGKKTQQGYGAEITITAEPVISDNLLPTVFRSLVKNDVIDLASAVMYDLTFEPLPPDTPPEADDLPEPLPENASDVDKRAYEAKMDKRLQDYQTKLQQHNWSQNNSERVKRMTRLGTRLGSSAQGGSNSDPARSDKIFSFKMLQALERLNNDLKFGTAEEQESKSYLILDKRKISERQIEAAYTLLAAPGNEDLWHYASPVASPSLLTAIRNCNQGDGTNDEAVEAIRDRFVLAIRARSGNSLKEEEHAVVGLAWAIIYKSTLLNQQLLDDMANVAGDQGGPCHPGGQWYEFFLPNPLPEARGLFAQYVRARWPIHVFAIDPMTADQNVADTFSRRRDMQLALSLAFTSGNIGAQNFTRYARRLELDMETIALNRTQVGFSHGSDTFGWRFYPRVQSPPIEGNAKVLFRDLLIGGPSRNADLNTMKLEPGARECVALVIMPSFVPYVRFDTRTNWFKLSNPKHKEFDLQTNVQLGTDITCLREFSACCQDDPYVRGTDLALLMRSVDQLEHRLPLQTCVSQVPFELTESGHTLFNHGVADLGPRLRGYYGEPGAKGKDISVAVIGSNFSVSDTHVIAGNVLLTDAQATMLSREVILLTIPAAAIAEGNKIDVHVATPYGVSNHLDIHLPKAPPPSIWTIAPQAATCTYVVHKKIDPDQPGHFECISYTPAVVAQFSGDLAITPNQVTIHFTFDDLGSFAVRAIKRPNNGDFIIDVKGLAQQLLNKLAEDGVNVIDDNNLPETNTYSLSPIAIEVNGRTSQIDGGFVITFKPKPQPAKK